MRSLSWRFFALSALVSSSILTCALPLTLTGESSTSAEVRRSPDLTALSENELRGMLVSLGYIHPSEARAVSRDQSNDETDESSGVNINRLLLADAEIEETLDKRQEHSPGPAEPTSSTHHLPPYIPVPIEVIPGGDGLVNDLLPGIYGALAGLDLKKRQDPANGLIGFLEQLITASTALVNRLTNSISQRQYEPDHSLPPYLIPGGDGLVNDLLPAIYGLLDGLDLKKRQYLPPGVVPGNDGLVNDLLPAIYGLLGSLDLKKRQELPPGVVPGNDGLVNDLLPAIYALLRALDL